MKIDLAAINRDDFDVKERDGIFLINPAKSKHVWTEEELKYRSLLVDRQTGEVLSSGFPKFRNYGEDKPDDVEFAHKLVRGEVSFAEKMDGTLIIADFRKGGMQLRTRGNFDLGDFRDEVMKMIEEKYPRFLGNDLAGFENCSWLFEYTSPENRIVIRYTEPTLTYLGFVDKDDLRLVVGAGPYFAAMFGVEAPKSHVLPTDFQELMKTVKGWDDKEGVVASYVDLNDEGLEVSRLIKIKATQYVKLHSIKFRLDGKVNKLAFLLGITTHEEAVEKLSAFGIDAEGQEYIKPELDVYLAKLSDVRRKWNWFVDDCSSIETSAVEDSPTGAERDIRKDYVQSVREWLTRSTFFSLDWFGAAMDLYDHDTEEAWLKIMAKVIFEDSVNMLRNWSGNPQTALDDMLTVPSTED
jgi:hypothetical protein